MRVPLHSFNWRCCTESLFHGLCTFPILINEFCFEAGEFSHISFVELLLEQCGHLRKTLCDNARSIDGVCKTEYDSEN